MQNYLKYGKSLLITIVPVLILSLLITTLYYFNIIGKGIVTYLKLILPILGLFAGGFYIGRKAEKKGWLEGLKVGGIVLVLLFLLRYLGFDQGFSLKMILYYLILIASSIFGSMIGISRKATKEA